MSQVNVRQLFEDKQKRLQLSRVAGADGTDRIIDSVLVETSNKGLIGHFNLIHPNWVQVLSQTELDYLNGLSTEQRDSAFSQIEQNGTTCLIVAGTTDIPTQLIDFANRSHIPLFASPLTSVHLMWLTRHYLAKELAESTTRHGVFLDVLGVGVMITGESAVGKSELGLELITRGNGLVADDIVELHRIAPDTLEGRCPELLRDFLEVRGLGVWRNGSAAKKEPEAHRAPASPARRRPVANGTFADQCHAPGYPRRKHQYGKHPGGRGTQSRSSG
jgi:HPr kinase/phosphorylase